MPFPVLFYTLLVVPLIVAGFGCGRSSVGGLDGDLDRDGEFLLSVDSDSKKLRKIFVDSGRSEVVCDLALAPDYPTLNGDPPWGALTFQDALVAARDDGIDEIDPCTCEVARIGWFGHDHVGGMVAVGDAVLGISVASDSLVEANLPSGDAEVVGSLGVDVRRLGATWKAGREQIYVLDSGQSALYGLDPATGRLEELHAIEAALDRIGIEVHPADGVLYGCSEEDFFAIDPSDGALESIGSLDFDGPCGNLAAPRAGAACL